MTVLRDHNYLCWKRYAEASVLPQLDLLKQLYEERLVPVFDNLAQQAEGVTENSWQKQMNAPVSNGDGGDLDACAETADDEGTDWLVRMWDLQSGVNGQFCIAVWSHVEKFLSYLLQWEKSLSEKPGDFARKFLAGLTSMAPPSEPGKQLPKGYTWQQIREKYQAAGIDLTAIQAFGAIDLLRLVNNVCKHGEGPALDELKKRESVPGLGNLSEAVLGAFGEVTVKNAYVLKAFGSAKEFILQVVERLAKAEPAGSSELRG